MAHPMRVEEAGGRRGEAQNHRKIWNREREEKKGKEFLGRGFAKFGNMHV